MLLCSAELVRKCLHTWWWPRSSKPLCGALTASQVGSIPMHFRFLFWHLTARYRTVSCNPVWHHGLPPVDTPLWRLLTIRYVRLLRRFLRHMRAGFCATLGRPLEVGVGHKQIMFHCYLGRVTHLGRQIGAFDDPVEL